MSEKNLTPEQLVEVLKFTPRTYKISMWGYGGEKVMGTVDPGVWEYCMENQVNLQDVAWNYDAVDDLGLDADKLPFPPGSWYECDNLAHVNGVSKSAGTLQIEDENGDEVMQLDLDNCDGCDDSPELEIGDEAWVGMCKKGETVFIGSSNEKGTFFEGDIELTQPFDITKLTLCIDDVDGEEIISGVKYDGEDIDNYGGSTDGKSSDFNMVRLTSDNGEFERYEPGEKDWGHPEFGSSPSDWESSPKFKFKQHKPVHVGYYSCNYGYGSTYSSLYWDGKSFGEWEYGKFKPVNQEGVVTWQGYNWDTSSWSNRPAEPPDVICTNKKCNHVGDSNQMVRNDDYDLVCPECGKTDFDWIDYDPDTAKGRKNREKYCIPPMPSIAEYHPNVLKQALDELADEFGTPTYDEIDALEQVECVQCDWKGAVEETFDKDGEMVCPECGEPVEFTNSSDEMPAAKWPFSTVEPFPTSTTNEEKEVTEESKSKWWTVKTYHKKNCEQIEYFVQRNGSGRIKVTDGFRWCEYNVETNDGEFPRFEFQKVPGGNDACDSLDMNCLSGDNIENSELVEMFDGGCWGGWEIEGVSEEEEAKLEEFLEENGSWALEDEGEWYLDETEVWIWGPILVIDEDGNERIIIADENGNVTDFEE